MRRPQFSLKTLLWLMALVGAFFGGAAWQRQSMIAGGWVQLLTPTQELLDAMKKEAQAIRSGAQE
jgi:hypothetical protein